MEADSSFAALAEPTFTSGELRVGGTYMHTFQQPGTHHYMSQNTASLTVRST